MKKGLIVAGLLLVLVVVAVACGSPEPGNISLLVSTGEFASEPHLTGEADVPAGDTFTLILGSNPTTGFSWSEEAQIGDTAVLKQVSHEYVAPDGEMAGAAGQEVWKFEALKAGMTTISLEYSRPWEGGEKAEWTYAVTVNVE